MRNLLLALLAAFPVNAGVDYQLGGDYPLPAGVTVVTRDRTGAPAAGAYNVCYVNGFQTQPGARWPDRLVLDEDPAWPDEFVLDVRRRAVERRINRMTDTCAAKGFDAVEFDNLDTFTRFDNLPFGRRAALHFARRIARHAHRRDLVVGQKNTAELTPREVRRIGFDFVVTEECARYGECERYRRLHGDAMVDIEYRRRDFERACATIGDTVSVVLRDLPLSTPPSKTYVFDSC